MRTYIALDCQLEPIGVVESAVNLDDAYSQARQADENTATVRKPLSDAEAEELRVSEYTWKVMAPRMNEQQIKEAAAHFGGRCSFEKLVTVGSFEHNGLRYDHIIPWESKQDEWVKQETRITGSTLTILETCQIRNFVIIEN